MMKISWGAKPFILVVVVTIVAIIGIQIVYGGVVEPGSQQDPVITLSYLEEVVVPQIYTYINNEIANLVQKFDDMANQVGKLEKDFSTANNATTGSFQVVSMQPGQKLIGGAGTELILRMGKGTIIATAKGGLADVTQGTDLQNGERVPPNHLLIIPLEDGRGFAATENVLVMIKGIYVLQ